MSLTNLYKPSLALLTDLYQLTMAAGYLKAGMAEQETAFHLFFRKNPFDGGFSLFSGLNQVIDYLNVFRFDGEDLAYLGSLCGADGKALFAGSFLDYLEALRFSCHVDAVPDGTVVFPHEPLLRVEGPVIQCQILETVLLNMVNFQTLIATKTARIVRAAAGDPVLEFGLRRAQGFDGALSAARAAYMGGCSATSNVLAGKMLGMPVRGTHAHSWVMAFSEELDAFQAYADAMPNNCIFLVDTYDTLEGVRKAVIVGKRLRAAGHEMLGIRLDSGDLAGLSSDARTILDEGGFPKARIFASNDLDEYAIAALKRRGAKIDAWGVGTKLVTAYDQPALGGVYKLGAIRDSGGPWQYRLKLSEEPIKTSNPGRQQVVRLSRGGRFVGDVIHDVELGFSGSGMVGHAGEVAALPEYDNLQALLQPVFRGGALVAPPVSLEESRLWASQQLAALPEGVAALAAPEAYPCGLDPSLYQVKKQLVEQHLKGG